MIIIIIMFDKETKSYFLEKIKCNYLVNKIFFLASPILGETLKKDIGTFHFTWSCYKDKYLSFISEFTPEYFYLYLNNLQKLESIIHKQKIKRNLDYCRFKIKHQTFFEKKIKRKIKVVDLLHIRAYTIEREILTSWSHEKTFLLNVHLLRSVDMLNLIKKVLLRLTSLGRLLFLKELGLLAM